MTVGWGILGIGGHADRWMAPAITTADNARLAGVWSRDQARADAFGAKHKSERAYSSLDEFLADPAVEMIYIGSPSHLHAEHAIACARAGKAILVDKPLDVTVEACQAIIDACREAGVLLATGYNQRYQPANVAAYEMLRAGRIGEPVLAKAECASFSSPRRREEMRSKNPDRTGTVLAIGTHVIDLLRWFLDDEVVEVAALTDGSDAGGKEELALAVLKFSRGAYAQVSSSLRLPWPTNDVAVHASNGYFRTTGAIIFDTGGKLEVTQRSETHSYEYRAPRPGYTPFTAEIEDLGKVLREGGTPRATGEDGLRGVRVALAIAEASATGKAVRL